MLVANNQHHPATDLMNTNRCASPLLRTDMTVLHTFIFSRSDYCSSLFTWLNQKSNNRLQIVQNSAARLLSRTKRSGYITSVLASGHWLPICCGIDFKILLLTSQFLCGLSHSYFSDLFVPHPCTELLGQRTFICSRGMAECLCWNHLNCGMNCLRKSGQQQSVTSFKSLL